MVIRWSGKQISEWCDITYAAVNDTYHRKIIFNFNFKAIIASCSSVDTRSNTYLMRTGDYSNDIKIQSKLFNAIKAKAIYFK